MTEERIHLEVPAELGGHRLDQALAELLPDHSRSRIQQWVRLGRVWVDGKTLRPRDKLLGGEQVQLEPLFEAEETSRPQPMGLNILYEDEAILVIDKPVGLVVHPAAGNPDGTLLNGLLHHDPALARVARAGIVHRIDKETSGLLVVARSPEAHTHLVAQLQAREIHREYRAIAQGQIIAGGSIDQPMGRHPSQRKRMAVLPNGKPAITHYRLLERFRAHSYLQVKLETGRTHQIRVHMAHIRHPLLGDPVYGGRLKLPGGASPELIEQLRGFRRQALHAFQLGLAHPFSGDWLEWQSPIPADMQHLLETLRADSQLDR
jgi:23S rRNA pseudouridine1911/1915/1917 synthase